MKKYDLSKYRARARSYGKSMNVSTADTAIVKMPVEVWHGQYMPLEEIPSPSELPLVPERIRDFAVRTVLEGYKPDREWSKLFGVTEATIGRWRRDDRVAKLRAYMLNERRGYLLAQTIGLEKKWWKRIDDLLDMKITGDTAPVLLNTLKYVRSLLNGEAPAGDHAALGTFNISVGMGPGGGVQVGASPFRQERDVTPQQIEKLQADIERERAFLKNYVEMKANMKVGGNGDGE